MKIHLPRIDSHVMSDIIKVAAFAISLFIIFMLFRIAAQNNLLARQAKQISEQNQKIAKANGAHIDCISRIFAAYTRDGRPITIDDLDKCKVTPAELQALTSGAVDFTSVPTTTSPAQTGQNQNSLNTGTSQDATKVTPTPAPDETKPPLLVVPQPSIGPVPLINQCLPLQLSNCN